MIKFKLKKYTWTCPSCGILHELILAVSEGGNKMKWIKSMGLKWHGEMMVGEPFGEGEPFDCAFCRTEFTYPDVLKIAKVVDGTPFNKEPKSEKPDGKSDS